MNIEYKQGSTIHNLNSIWLNDWLNKYSFDDAFIYLAPCYQGGWKVGKERKKKEKKRQKYAIHDSTKIYFCNRIYSEHDTDVKSAEIIR